MTFTDFIDQAWNDHGDDAVSVADRLANHSCNGRIGIAWQISRLGIIGSANSRAFANFATWTWLR